jgi:hypothetical protein
MRPGSQIRCPGSLPGLQVINPTPRCRLMIDLTASHHGFGDIKLPPSRLSGPRGRAWPVGSGSSRRVRRRSNHTVDRRPGVCCPRPGEPAYEVLAPQRPVGAYGGELRTDRRWIVGWSRDVSLLSEEEYERWTRQPGSLDRTDLLHPTWSIRGFARTAGSAARATSGWVRTQNHKSVLVSGLTVQLPNEKPSTPS